MTPPELRRIATRMYGPIHWCSQIALNLGVDNATVYRWSKHAPDWQLPHIAEVAVRGLLNQYKANRAAEKLVREQLRKAGKLRPKLKLKKKRAPRPAKPLGEDGKEEASAQ